MVEGEGTVRMEVTVDARFAQKLRVELARAAGTKTVWFEHLSRWLLEHPEAMREVTGRMKVELAGGRRRRDRRAKPRPGA